MKLIHIENLDKCGVYQIINTRNGKKYIGSTSLNFRYRFNLHINDLRKNVHKNAHLQNVYNKYGEDIFDVEIIEITSKENALTREQFYIDCYELEDLYNINPIASKPPLTKDIISKRSKTLSETNNIAKEYKAELEKGNITLEDIPKKYKKLVDHKSKAIAWNKGLTKEKIDYSFLKGVKKTITPALTAANKRKSEKMLSKSPKIYVYKNTQLLGEYKNSTEVSNDEERLSNYMIVKNKNGRNGYPFYHLNNFNIMKSTRDGLPYKGLHFKLAPL